MDLTLVDFFVALDTFEAELVASIPMDAKGGKCGGPGCIIAYTFFVWHEMIVSHYLIITGIGMLTFVDCFRV